MCELVDRLVYEEGCQAFALADYVYVISLVAVERKKDK